jgi:hypothetical protein
MRHSFLYAQQRQEKRMKKVSLALAAVATIAVAAPTLASAQSFGFSVGPDRDYRYGDRYYDNGPRAEFYGRDRAWDRGYHRDNDRVIIRRHHHWDD